MPDLFIPGNPLTPLRFSGFPFFVRGFFFGSNSLMMRVME